MASYVHELIVEATKNHWRFQGTGIIASVEDLWELSTAKIDDIARNIDSAIKEIDAHPMSLSESVNHGKIGDEPSESESRRKDLYDKMDILRFILETRREEAEKFTAESEKAARKNRILELIAKKEDQQFDNMSVEDLRALLDE